MSLGFWILFPIMPPIPAPPPATHRLWTLRGDWLETLRGRSMVDEIPSPPGHTKRIDRTVAGQQSIRNKYDPQRSKSAFAGALGNAAPAGAIAVTGIVASTFSSLKLSPQTLPVCARKNPKAISTLDAGTSRTIS